MDVKYVAARLSKSKVPDIVFFYRLYFDINLVNSSVSYRILCVSMKELTFTM